MFKETKLQNSHDLDPLTLNTYLSKDPPLPLPPTTHKKQGSKINVNKLETVQYGRKITKLPTVDLENTPVALVYAHFFFVTKKLCYKLLIFLFYIIGV